MTFKQIEFFVLVCQYESIARVSELNFVSPQSISRMIKDLESEFNTCLLTRTNNGVIPTKVGEYLQSECMALLERKDRLTKNIFHMNTASKTTVNIGMSTGSIAALNYHAFDDFQSEYPDVQINYNEYIDCDLVNRFLNNEFDLCISTHPIHNGLYHNARLLDEQVYLSIPMNHDLYSTPHIKMEDLKNYEFAMFTDEFHIRKKFLNCFRDVGFSPNIKVSLNDFNSIKSLAYKNNLLSLDVQHSLKKEYGFRHIPFPCSDLTHELWGVKKHSPTSNLIDSLFQHLQKNTL